MNIPITHVSFKAERPLYGHSSDQSLKMTQATLTVAIEHRFISYFATSDPPCTTNQNTLERAFIKLIPHLDPETLDEILRTAATARLNR